MGMDVPTDLRDASGKLTKYVGAGVAPDGHKRHTKGDGFVLHGGSSEHHEAATHAFVKTSEELARKGHDLHSAEIPRVVELLDKHGYRITPA